MKLDKRPSLRRFISSVSRQKHLATGHKKNPGQHKGLSGQVSETCSRPEVSGIGGHAAGRAHRPVPPPKTENQAGAGAA